MKPVWISQFKRMYFSAPSTDASFINLWCTNFWQSVKIISQYFFFNLNFLAVPLGPFHTINDLIWKEILFFMLIKKMSGLEHSICTTSPLFFLYNQHPLLNSFCFKTTLQFFCHSWNMGRGKLPYIEVVFLLPMKSRRELNRFRLHN